MGDHILSSSSTKMDKAIIIENRADRLLLASSIIAAASLRREKQSAIMTFQIIPADLKDQTFPSHKPPPNRARAMAGGFIAADTGLTCLSNIISQADQDHGKFQIPVQDIGAL